ncbi:MAG: thymidine phosphorylase family protein [Phenylobacterium sp.]|uniref:thymidine phosphorylase family protein n=1 Tax=Phenylobacterium sp. TaxID=1871053 RepID=UPI00391B0E0F
MADDARQGAELIAAAGTLKARPLGLDTFRENIVVLARCSRVMRPERLRGARKVEVRAGGRTLLASTMIGDDHLVGPDEIGLPQPLFRRLGVAPGDPVQIAPARPPRSLSAIRDKVAGVALDEEAFAAVARDLAEHRWSDMEVAAFLIACASFMSPEETLALTRGMVAAGSRLEWNGRLVVDKHCIGGIPGNRTSLIVAPIVAAHGMTMPKTSSRAITSPAGTADTMEVLARVDLSEHEMREVVERCGACVVWGGRVNLSPADDVLVSVERPLSIDTPEQMVASILSKKVAAGVGRLVLDLPVGPSAKLRDRRAALRLKKLFEYVAGHLGLEIEVLFTDGSQPIGRGVGPALEARDVLAVLAGRPDAPADLRDKAIRLAGRVLEADPELPGGRGEARARDLLESGAARAKMAEIMAAQGASPLSSGLGGLVHEVPATASGLVAQIDCLRIANVARLAGAPTDAGAGVDLLKRVGDPVRAGEPLYRIHGSDPSDFAFAVEAAEMNGGFTVAEASL